MREDWNARAEEDHRFYIASGHATSDEAFRTSGVNEVEHVILDGIEIDAEATVLEIGCGVGRLLLPFARRVAFVYGVDISEGMIQRAKDFCGPAANIVTRVTDGTLSAFVSDSVDFVFSYIVFQHIPEAGPIALYIQEAARVLRPGGILRFQVDGRAHLAEPSDWMPNTYDGLKFSASTIRELVRDANLEILEEWGMDTHYYWITACKPSRGVQAAVRHRPRQFDRAALVALLQSIGSKAPADDADSIICGKESLRRMVAPLERSLAEVDEGDFVTEVYRRVLGRTPDRESLAFHVQNLRSDRVLEDRSEFIDSFLMGRVVRDLFFPAIPPFPWYRGEHIKETLRSHGYTTLTKLSFLDATEVLMLAIRTLPADAAVDYCFGAILGQSPDDHARRHYLDLLGSNTFGRHFLVREILTAPPSRPVPPCPPPRRVAALQATLGPREPSVSSEDCGESFPGEARVARHLLAEGAKDDARSFVQRAYSRILARSPDKGGEAFYSEVLVSGKLSRPMFLRELLWSDELRSP